MNVKLPRILSPNLGCPVILSPEDLETKGMDIVIAEEDGSAEVSFTLLARPSFPGEGVDFPMELVKKGELTEDALPPSFERIEETRFLMSTVLRSLIFGGQARFFLYRAKLISTPGEGMLRDIDHQPRPTLYDLQLKRGERRAGTVFHALGLRPPEERLRFIHLTDLHTALRNDLYEANLSDTVSYPTAGDAARNRFNNFNENLRRFIRYANDLADEGELDFVLMLGDLVDFLHHGFHGRKDFGDNNCRIFRDLILGGGNEQNRPTPNPGLKVPIFTATGNHDWRLFPYDPSAKNTILGLDKAAAEQLDLVWADEQEEISDKVETVYKKLVSEGTPISNHTRLGWLINVALRRLEKWQVQLLTPLGASVVAGFLAKIPGVGTFLEGFLGPYYAILTGLIALVAVPIATAGLAGLIKWFVRKKIWDIIAVEAGWQALQDYFLSVNPYFNYAFRLGRNYFLILDTGHDCLRAQYLWDGGDKKLGSLSISDNLIGGSPDSMAFYDINEYYPYSQISWMDRLLERISREEEEGTPPGRTVIGLHAPAANLSPEERQKAGRIPGNLPEGVRLPKGQFNIHYGTINHYVSQFLHLCLGRVERDPGTPRYRPVDLVLAGHAHWKLEMRLAWDQKMNRPALYYGDFTKDGNQFCKTFEKLRPFLLQTPASGPREKFSPAPPYFRRLEIDGQGNVCAAEVLALTPDGAVYQPDFPL